LISAGIDAIVIGRLFKLQEGLSMKDIDRNLMLVALSWLLVGTFFGLWMGATNSLGYVTIHVAMLLPGFVTLAVYSMIYRLWPELKSSRLATVQFWVSVIGQLFAVIGTWHNLATGGIFIVAPASTAVIVAALLMTWQFWNSAKRA
jgi:hypothetical protein